MRRRDFIKIIAGSATAWPLATRAQERGHIYRLGFLVPPPRQSPAVAAFLDELRQNGFVEGDNLIIIPGGFEATDKHLAEQAAALINAAPDAIVAGPELPLQALQALTHTVPLVGMTEDMVAAGLVKSLAHPGGNTTGISLLSPELDCKRQDILIEMVPAAHRIAAIADGRITPTFHGKMLRQGARSRGVPRFSCWFSAGRRLQRSGRWQIDGSAFQLYPQSHLRNEDIPARIRCICEGGAPRPD
jgi:putative ABC transport system substrate-binding protein